MIQKEGVLQGKAILGVHFEPAPFCTARAASGPKAFCGKSFALSSLGLGPSILTFLCVFGVLLFPVHDWGALTSHEGGRAVCSLTGQRPRTIVTFPQKQKPVARFPEPSRRCLGVQPPVLGSLSASQLREAKIQMLSFLPRELTKRSQTHPKCTDILGGAGGGGADHPSNSCPL